MSELDPNTVPNPLPAIGRQVLFYDVNGEQCPAWVILPAADFGQGQRSLIAWCSRNGWNWSYMEYDESATPIPDTWRFDPRFPADSFPSDLIARIEALEQGSVQSTAAPADTASALREEIAMLTRRVTDLEAARTAAQARRKKR